jgi:hypothetical protein
MMMKSDCDNKYLKCLFGVEAGAAKIPDGDTHHTVAIEFRQNQTLKPDSTGQLVVVCQPGLPGSLRVRRGGGALTTAGGGTVNIADANALTYGYSVPYVDFQQDINTESVRSNYATSILAARVVKYQMEVTQVGPVLNQQGNVATARIPCYANNKTILPFYGDWTAAGVIAPSTTYANLAGAFVGQPVSDSALTFDKVASYPTVKICNATEACMLLGKGCGDWVPSYLSSVYWTDGTRSSDGVLGIVNMPIASTTDSTGTTIIGAVGGKASSTTLVYPYLPQGTGAAILPGDFWLDPDCEGLCWAGNNLGTDTTFEVRVTVCMELQVSFASSIYRPIVTPPAKHDPAAIEVADAAMKLMPPSISKAEGAQSWWNALSTSVTGVADLVAGMGIPIASTAAAVGGKLMRLIGLSS